jgi:hypothetical protein
VRKVTDYIPSVVPGRPGTDCGISFRKNLKRIPQIRANTTTPAAAAPTDKMDSPPKGRTD